MKIRQGFVSNSSSSSFIIAYKNVDACPHCGRSDVDFKKVVENGTDRYGDETRLRSDNVNDIIFGVDSDYYDESQKKKVKSIIEKYQKMGYEIIDCEINYHDDVVREMLDNMKSAGTAFVISQID